MSKTVILAVGICACAFLLAFLFACAPREEYGGTVHTEAVYAGSMTGGRVNQVFVQPSDRVVAGQLLVGLDDRMQQAQKKVAQARLDQARFQLDEASLDPRYLPAARVALEGAQAALDSADAALDELSIRSPANGVVESIDLQPGDILLPGDTAVVIDTQKDPYVTIYVPQQDLAPFAVGQSLVVHSDALPGETFVGVVEERDPSAQFTPRNVQTAGDRASLTFGIKVRIKDAGTRLYAGTTVTVLPP